MAWLRMATWHLISRTKSPDVSATLSTDLFTLDPYLAAQNTTTTNKDPGNADWNTVRAFIYRLNGVDGNL